jgi:hypothetical protein
LTGRYPKKVSVSAYGSLVFGVVFGNGGCG